MFDVRVPLPPAARVDPPRPTALRISLGLAAVAIANALIFLAAPMALVTVFFAFPFGLVAPLLLLAAVAAATIVILRIAVGRRLIWSGVLAALAGAITFGVLMARAGEIPMLWIPALSIDVGGMPAGVVAAGAAALAVPRWWARVAGAVVVGGAIALVAVPASVAAEQQRVIDEQHELESREQYLEQQLDTLTRPVTADVPGIETRWIGGGEYISHAALVTADGGALWVQAVGDSPDAGREEYPCWLMKPIPGSGFDETITMDDYSGVCERDGDRFVLTDGTGIALMFEGRLVLVTVPLDVFYDDMDAERMATADELEAAAASLRTLTRDEFRDVLLAVGTAD